MHRHIVLEHCQALNMLMSLVRSQVAWPLSVLVPPLALAQYQLLFRLQLELAVAQRELSAAAQLHKAARRLPGCASAQNHHIRPGCTAAACTGLVLHASRGHHRTCLRADVGVAPPVTAA